MSAMPDDAESRAKVNPAFAHKRRVLPHDGRRVTGMALDFQGDGEHWQNYLCEDGTMVKVKLTVAEIVRCDGERDKDGNVLYIACSRVIVQPVFPAGDLP